MSSYLTFYGVPKTHPEEKLAIFSVCRINDLYAAFVDNIHVAFVDDKEPYTELTEADVNVVINDMMDEMSVIKDRLVEYERYAHGNPECINNIIEDKKELAGLQYTLDEVQFIMNIVSDTNVDCTDFSKILCNID